MFKKIIPALTLLLLVMTASAPAQSFEASMNAGNNALERGDFNQAINNFRAATQREPRSFEAQFNLAFALLGAGRHGNAEAEFKKALGLRPDDSNAWLNLSIALQNQGKIGDALDALSKATKADPSNTVARVNLASSYAASGRLTQALAEYKAMVDEGYTSPDILINYAKCLITGNRIDEAKLYLQKALEGDPNNIEARWELADLYKKFDKDLNRAAQELRLAIAAKSDDPKLYEALASILEEQDKRPEAAEQVRRALIYTNDQLEKGRLQRWHDNLTGKTSVTGSGTATPTPTPGTMQTLKRESDTPPRRAPTTPAKTPNVNLNMDDLMTDDTPASNPFDDIKKRSR